MNVQVSCHMDEKETVTIHNVGPVDFDNNLGNCIYLTVNNHAVLFFQTVEQVKQLRNDLTTWLMTNSKFEDMVKGAMDGDIVKETRAGTETDTRKAGSKYDSNGQPV